MFKKNLFFRGSWTADRFIIIIVYNDKIRYKYPVRKNHSYVAKTLNIQFFSCTEKIIKQKQEELCLTFSAASHWRLFQFFSNKIQLIIEKTGKETITEDSHHSQTTFSIFSYWKRNLHLGGNETDNDLIRNSIAIIRRSERSAKLTISDKRTTSSKRIEKRPFRKRRDFRFSITIFSGGVLLFDFTQKRTAQRLATVC